MLDRGDEPLSANDPGFGPADFFALRTPLLPFDDLLAFGDGLKSAGADPMELDVAIAEDQALLRERLRAIVARPEVHEALFVASRSLHLSLGEWLEHPEEKRGRKIERALVRYLERMTTRSTPFGLFAGLSIGSFAARTRLELAPRARYQRHTRLDMDYVSALSEALPHDPALRPGLRFQPNSSLYKIGNQFRYAEARLNGKERSYHLVAVEATDYLIATLARAAQGARPSELANALVDDEITTEDADDFIRELIESQILISGLSPAVTGTEPVYNMLTQLSDQAAATKAVERLAEAQTAIEALDTEGVGIEPARYTAIAQLLADLPTPVEPSRLLQIDMFKPVVEASLSSAVVEEIIRGVTLLQRSSSRDDQPLQRFAEEFARRYEEREVPLMEALDEESGIGFERSPAAAAEAAPLLAGMAIPSKTETQKVPWGSRQQFLLKKLEQAWGSGSMEIALSDTDWKALEGESPSPLPDSFAVMAAVIAASNDALDAGQFRVHVQGALGPSSARLLGRFCHGDPVLTGCLIRQLRAEEALEPEVVFAEIVHLPEGRIGNVLLRPVLRHYEIPFLARSMLPSERQVPIDDLHVAVKDGTVILRSARLGRRVVPRLSTAHNYRGSRNLNVYRFLGSLQGQSVSTALSWNWGPFEGARFLPRVTSGRLIISLAQWQIESEHLEPLGKTRGSERFRRGQALRVELGLPRFIAVEQDGNELPVDFDNLLSIETFAELVKDRPTAKLVELAQSADALCAHGPEGRFCHELVVPMLRQREPTPATLQPRRWPSAARCFSPGSEWLYVKFYAGPSSIDRILAGPVAEVVADLAGAFDCWFFLRYADPDLHLRLRFHGAPERLHRELVPALERVAKSVIGSGDGWRLQLDTYEREVERYGGGEGLALSEQVFHVDSEAVLGIVGLLSGDDGADERWRLTLRGMHALLDDLGLDLTARRRVIQRLRKTFSEEFRLDGRVGRQLGERYRRHRTALETLLDSSGDEASNLAPGIDLLRRRSCRLAPVIAELASAVESGRLSRTIEELAPSYLHMHANRMLHSAQRPQELVIYDFLNRLYESQAARE